MAGSEQSSFQQGHSYPPSANTGLASLSTGSFSHCLHLSESSTAKDRNRHSFPGEILEPSLSIPPGCRTAGACWHSAAGVIWCKGNGEAAWYWDLSYSQIAMGGWALTEGNRMTMSMSACFTQHSQVQLLHILRDALFPAPREDFLVL